MILLIVSLVMIALGIVIAKFWDDWDSLGVLITFLGGLVLFLTLLVGVLNYCDTKTSVEKYEALSETIREARTNGSNEIERAALIKKIADVNEELASARYWNQTSFGMFIADEYANLKPLK